MNIVQLKRKIRESEEQRDLRYVEYTEARRVYSETCRKLNSLRRKLAKLGHSDIERA